MNSFLHFFLGAAIGSFLNVIALRYDPDKFILGAHTLGGRSYCPKCKRTLRWFELLPLVSFIIQGARCRRCRTRISPQYIVTEIVSGLLWVIAFGLIGPLAFSPRILVLVLVWIAIFETLLLMSLIDIRLMLIPDELNIALGVLGGILSFLAQPDFTNRIIASLGAGLFFAALVLGTRGRGMGIGDIKLAAALGLVFGAPLIVFTVMVSFIIGSVIGIGLIAFNRGTMKTAIPFGPFLALGALVAFLWGGAIVSFFAMNIQTGPW